MSKDRITLLAAEMDYAYQSIRRRLEGLTDDEFFWQPVPDCWTVRQLPDGRWTVDYEQPDPEPPPFTTIAWRLVHVSGCKIMYHEYAFGPARLTWDSLDLPHTAATATAQLEEGHALLRADLDSLADDAALDELRLTNWGERWPTWQIFWIMTFHDLHHGGEIACLRDLYTANQRDVRRR